jgi:hypothetical protein
VLSTAALLDATEQSRPADFTKNGWVVEALQGVVAISTTPVPEEDPAAKVFALIICGLRWRPVFAVGETPIRSQRLPVS